VFGANRAFVARLRGRLAEARQGYEAALAVLERAEDRNYLALVLGNLGEIDLLEGAVERGRARLEAAVALAHRAGFAMIEGVFRGTLAWERALRTGDPSGFPAADRLLRDGGFRDEHSRLLARWAEAEARHGAIAAARERLAEAEALDRGVPWVVAAIAAARTALNGDLAGSAGASLRVG
jgi:tetratricopeptide (TPR) repeat protein